jgi:ABC-type bacteriocin/lantibiotic exporter with double-glycine peptidase domain
MIDANLKKYLPSSFVRTMLALITIEQLAGASATALLALTAKSLTSPHQMAAFLLGFFIVIQIPSVILIFLRKAEAHGYLEAYQNLLDHRLFALSGKPAIWSNRAQSKKYLAAIGPEADTYLAATGYTQFDFFTYILNIVGNSTALALIIDANFGWIFAVSLISSFLLYRRLESPLQVLVEREQDQRLSISAYVMNSWDNVLLHNKPVLANYRKILAGKFKHTKHLAGQSAERAAVLVLGLGFVSSLPVFALNALLAYRNVGDPAFLAALMITLPRQLNVLQTFRAFFQQLTNYRIFSARLNSVIANSEVTEADIPSLIDFSKIRLDGARPDSLEDFLGQIKNRSSGRLHISGVNGAGKSSLLLLLNEHLPDSLYLPASPQLEIENDGTVSTGQNLLRHLDYLFAQSSPVILLDEWDANLDEHNRNEVSARIDAAAQSRLIIEVRHRLSS